MSGKVNSLNVSVATGILVSRIKNIKSTQINEGVTGKPFNLVINNIFVVD